MPSAVISSEWYLSVMMSPPIFSLSLLCRLGKWQDPSGWWKVTPPSGWTCFASALARNGMISRLSVPVLLLTCVRHKKVGGAIVINNREKQTDTKWVPVAERNDAAFTPMCLSLQGGARFSPRRSLRSWLQVLRRSQKRM
jgi:hypothetical protein